MVKLNSYLNFDGTAEEAFNFYKTIFGGDFIGPIRRMKDAPGIENLSEESKNRILHIALPIGNDLLMASDIIPEFGQTLQYGNSNYISVFPESREEADRLFWMLSDGGLVEMPIEDQFWGDYFGSCRDKFGVNWMVNYSEDIGYES